MDDFRDMCQMVTTLLGPQVQEHLEKADRLKGQRLSESMKRTRQQLVEDFAKPVSLNA